MLEFDINNQSFRAGKLNAFTQLHVSRKIAPVLPKVLPAFFQLTAADAAAKQDIAVLSAVFEPVAQALANIPDTDCEYVFSACLSVVTIKQGSSYMPIWNDAHKTLLFDSIDLAVMTQIVGKVLWDNLGNFIHGFASTEQAVSPAMQA